MKTIAIDCWTEFESTVRKARNELSGLDDSNPILFRGQPNSAWGLETTLERRSSSPFDVLRYAELISRHKQEVMALTGTDWSIPDYPDWTRELKDNFNWSHPVLPFYGYHVYMRQLGFASPLLDWTRSPYIAAYFAFHQPPSHIKTANTGSVAVYVFSERPDGLKGGYTGAPMIHVQGPYVGTHSRHFTQQSWYTVCTACDEGRTRHDYVPHQLGLDGNGVGEARQDLIIKITIPQSERRVALAALAEANLNHFTLFQTEDSLIQALDSRAFDLEQA